MPSVTGQYAHPGQFLRHWVLPEREALGALAKRVGISRQSLSYILNERSGITPKVAEGIERELGVNKETLLAMDLAYRAQNKKKRATRQK